jgi:hypothetical protein
MSLAPMDYANAITVQDACNISGVIKSMASVLDRINDTAHTKGLGTDWINRHPILILYASKLASLTHSEFQNEFSTAYRVCKENSLVLSDTWSANG